MSTEIKLGGGRLREWLEKNSERNFCYLPTGPEFLIAVLSDESKVHDTPSFGKLGLLFGWSMVHGIERYTRSSSIVLNCEYIRLLQARTNRRYRRAVEINPEGIGRQQLDKGVDLIITTGAFDGIRGQKNG